jgi:hypothetical protein
MTLLILNFISYPHKENRKTLIVLIHISYYIQYIYVYNHITYTVYILILCNICRHSQWYRHTTDSVVSSLQYKTSLLIQQPTTCTNNSDYIHILHAISSDWYDLTLIIEQIESSESRIQELWRLVTCTIECYTVCMSFSLHDIISIIQECTPTQSSVDCTTSIEVIQLFSSFIFDYNELKDSSSKQLQYRINCVVSHIRLESLRCLSTLSLKLSTISTYLTPFHINYITTATILLCKHLYTLCCNGIHERTLKVYCNLLDTLGDILFQHHINIAIEDIWVYVYMSMIHLSKTTHTHIKELFHIVVKLM